MISKENKLSNGQGEAITAHLPLCSGFPPGFIIGRLSDLLDGESLFNYFGQFLSASHLKKLPMDYQEASDQITFIYIPEGVKNDFPLIGIQIQEDKVVLRHQSMTLLLQKHLLIIAGKGSNTCFYQVNQGENSQVDHDVFIAMHMLIFMQSNAKLAAYALHNPANSALSQFSCKVYQESGSFFKHAIVDLGKSNLKRDINIALQDKEAAYTLSHFVLAKAKQVIDMKVCVNHEAVNTFSKQYHQAIAHQKAKSAFRSEVKVREGAEGAETHQTSRNLLLSTQAKVITEPILEVYADAVQCSHGATVGQLDQEALFYLQARGIEKVEASCFLMEGLLDFVLNDIELIALRDIFTQEAKKSIYHVLSY